MYASSWQITGETNQVILVWIYEHQGISGNERDGLAKLGTGMDPVKQIVPFMLGKKMIKDMLEWEQI